MTPPRQPTGAIERPKRTLILHRLRGYFQARPRDAYLIEVAFLLALYGAGGLVFPGERRHGPFPFFVCLAVFQPSYLLAMRFSEERRRERPILAAQERGVGLLFLAASLCSIGASGVGFFAAHLGCLADRAVTTLFVFGLSAVLSLTLGYAARHTWAGRWGLRLTAAWLLLLVGFAAVRLAWRAAGAA